MNQEFDKVKRLFLKPFKAKPVQQPSPPVPAGVQQTAHTTGLQPKFVVPPVPHPCPHEYLSIIASPAGLLLRPHLSGRVKPESHIRVAWGKEGLVEEIQNSGEGDGLDWADAVIVHGVLGILNLFTASYLLVISSRTDVGDFLDEQHTVYCVKSVGVVPLTETRARTALSRLASIHAHADHLPTAASEATFSDAVDSSLPPRESSEGELSTSSPRVKFAAEDQVKMMTPKASDRFDLPDDEDNSPPSPDSIISTPSSEYSVNTGNIAKVLADKLSFWSRLSTRRPSVSTPGQPLGQAEGLLQEETDEREGPVSLDNIIQQGSQEPSEVREEILSSTAPAPATLEEKHNELEDKIIRDVVREYTRGVMFFSYTFDITRSLQYKQELVVKDKRKNALLADLNALEDGHQLAQPEDKVDVLAEPNAILPLWRRVDRQFWWNEWLSKPFVDAGIHSYVLPVMQGFYQIATFSVPREPVAGETGDAAIVDYIIVSRRSRDRAGLRYQRRGIDDDANVANFVETETIMRVEREAFVNVFSHIQIRGSIPLFWAQTGYGLKPPPVLSTERTHGQNLDAMRRHFAKTLHRYGPHTIVNLAEQQGREGAVTNAYGQYVKELGNPDIQYNDYDFHKETRGMKYENISHLIEKMERIFEAQGYLWVSNGSIMSHQKGVFRVNCIDCLDRTNVVESAFARYVLQRQLGAVALLPNSEAGRTEGDIVFNDVWANNGDAISRAYAGTSALKGDFTRTGRRDLTGMLNDGVNSLARMYTSTFGDWFNQAVIDFMLGNRTLSVFSEFLLKLQSSDPSELIRISKIRAEAIATSVARVLVEGERLLSGWTLFSPADVNTRVGRFEEKVLLLSVKALYIISYDYTLEKVKMYTRVPLGDIVTISKGAYILSPLEEGSRDPNQNAGFVVTWRNTNQDTRVTSYSIRNSLETPPPSPGGGPPASPRTITSPRLSRAPSKKGTALSRILSNAATPILNDDVTFAAFKSLPIDPARSRRENGSFVEPADELTGATSCKEAVDLMVEAIRRACADVGNTHPEFVKVEDVVSLAEAQRMTSVYSKMEYGVKRLLWLGG
ncbi:SacI homology domain-containing protein [Cristinia sonorae]|uniref:SacI homology domain-containing protein n=1 Tax=Cristinia sonorae TaxID=1940300 RepID=A0A8K0UY08_9AGAR|nr:SacI homology domain-containing protein [Cristinia sonorae]